jgi:glycosyltransferase involved in cell wall biosynthesis
MSAVPAPSPTVSVVIPCYNAARYLESALASVQAQTFTDFELIVVNDGSTDNSLALLNAIAAREPRLRIISRPNTGIVGALNDGLAAARGEFIARMDADDLCFPDRFAKQVAYLCAHPDCVCVGTSVIFMDAHSRPVKHVPRQTAHEQIEAALLSGDGGALIHPSVMMRLAAVVAVGGYRLPAQHVEDIDLFLRLARAGRLANLPESLLRYRVHPQSINFTKNEGRYEKLEYVLRQANEARGLPFHRPARPDPAKAWSSIVDIHREWAATALEFGSRRVAVQHAWRACRIEPFNGRSWRALRYALTAPIRQSAAHS